MTQLSTVFSSLTSGVPTFIRSLFRKTFFTGALFSLMFLLSSHELFLKTESYFLQKGESAEVYLFNGTFDNSENAITTDRIVGAQIHGTNFDFLPRDSDYKIKDKVTYLKFKPGDPGTYTAGISTLPRMIELDSKAFKEYLEHEGLEDMIAERKEKGLENQSVREKYSKHVKAILQVGGARTDHFSKEFGYPIEFVPVKNPYTLKVGDRATFKLLLDGEPLADQGVHISSRNDGVDPFAKEIPSRTDEQGQVSFEITETGHWYVATIHMVESSEEDVEYESNWATITFEVGLGATE
jgi:hypothetical protein